MTMRSQTWPLAKERNAAPSVGRVLSMLAVLGAFFVLAAAGDQHTPAAWAAPAAADSRQAELEEEAPPVEVSPEAEFPALEAEAPPPEPAPAADAPSRGGPEGWQASFQAVGQPSIRGSLDSPSPGQTIPAGSPLVVAGWVANLDDPEPPGVLEVHVYDGVLEGGALLGQAQLGLAKPDVAQLLGDERFGSTGFRLEVAPGRLAPGQRVISVYVRTSENGWWGRSLTIQVQAPPPTSTPAPVPQASPSAPTAGGPRPTVPPLTTNTAPKVDDPELVRAFDEAGSWRSNIRETAAKYLTRVYFSSDMPDEALAVYSPSRNEIRVHPGFKQVKDKTVLTTILVHEATHLIDFVRDPDRFLSAEGCYATEVNAFEVEMTYWKEAHGLQGKQLTSTLLREDFWGYVFADYFNRSLRAFLGSRSDYEQRLRQVYVPQCAWRA